jgi:eukaryotic-like serine/threonine-protein kinase
MPEYFLGVPYPTLSRYEIQLASESILGKGGMGIVFKAHDRLLDREVVIKTINPSLLNINLLKTEFHHRLFFREAMTHARLGILHPEYIVKVNNYGIEDDTPFMEMELLEGGSLLDRITEAKNLRKRGPLFDDNVIKGIAMNICEGLSILHSNRVYHSDLKPGNILFKKVGAIDLKIADLGIARIAQSGILTKAGVDTFHGGTMHYTPQAVVEKRQKANERTDLYSVGIMIYEMLARVPLMWSDANADKVDRSDELSRPAKDIIKRTCQLLGRNNFGSASELQEKLKLINLIE